MKDKKEIGDIFRDAFQNYERQPSHRIWQNIESQGIKPVSKTYFTPKNIFLSIGAVTIISFAVYFALPSAQNIQKSNQIAKQDIIPNKTNQDSTYDISVPAETQNTNNTSPNTTTSETQKPNTQTASTPSITQQNQVVQPQNTITPVITTPTSTNPVPIISPKPTTSINTNNTLNSTPSTINIQSPEKKSATISFTPNQSICRGDKVKLEAIGGINWLWSTGERTSSIIVSPESSENYTVVVTDEYGTKHTGLIEVNIENCDVVYVPNAFTPNGDGYYDEFKAVGSNVKEFEILVFSRNGQLVFQSKDINHGWDGTIKGSAAPAGVYVYKIRYIDALNKPHQLSGSLTLIR